VTHRYTVWVADKVLLWVTNIIYSCLKCLFFSPTEKQSYFVLCSNDVYDAETGVDKDKRESVVNMTGRWGHDLMGCWLSLSLNLCFSPKSQSLVLRESENLLIFQEHFCGPIHLF
jgi:hypothetical protein